MSKVVAIGLIKKGRLDIRNRKDFTQRIRQMRDGSVTITVERTHATRSLQQSRYYWGVIVDLLSQHTGYTPDEIHEILKAKFIPKHLAVADENGVIKGEFVIGGTTTTLDKLEFAEFTESIRRWAAEDLGVVIPDPDTGALWPGAQGQP